VEALAGVLSAAMKRGEMRRADPKVIRQLVRRAVEMFFAGTAPR